MSRLEKIKQHQYDGYTIWDMGEDNLVWLIEQAERVQELEEDSRDATFAIDMLESENKRYREALEFYAERDNYTTNIRDDDFNYHQAVFFDNGKKARQALKGESE